MAQVNEVMQQAMAFLSRHGLAANPTNYTVTYEYIAGSNDALAQAMDVFGQSGKVLDNYVMENFHTEFVLKRDDLQDQIVDDIDGLLDGMSEQSSLSKVSIDSYVDNLNQGIIALNSSDLEQNRLAVKRLLDATQLMKKNQQKLQEKLLVSCAQTEHLRMEVEEFNKQRTTDTLTGLQNVHVLQPQMENWLEQYPQRKIAAIAIDIDDFRRFNDSYGHLVGDVVLNKIARKISHYVAQSGLPVRVGGEEFLILLPDVDLHTANEVAEQVRKGVEKMKFVSARSKRTLPAVTISLGTASFRGYEQLGQFVARADSALLHAKSNGRNRVSSEMAFS
jgi:diguanylate cyclase